IPVSLFLRRLRMKSKLRSRCHEFATAGAPMPSIRSERSVRVADMFGIERLASPASICDGWDDSQLRKILPGGGEVLLLRGPSGAGKSSLLRARRRVARQDIRWIDLARIQFPGAPVVDCFGNVPICSVLSLLSRVGLAEAWTYLRLPRELSEGQKWRLKLAMAI